MQSKISQIRSDNILHILTALYTVAFATVAAALAHMYVASATFDVACLQHITDMAWSYMKDC